MKFFLILTLILVSACTTGYKRYSWDGGYKDKDLGDGKFRVEYYGNGSTSQELVLERWHKRSAELCPKGYTVISNNAEAEEINTVLFSGAALIPFAVTHPKVIGEIQCQ